MPLNLWRVSKLPYLLGRLAVVGVVVLCAAEISGISSAAAVDPAPAKRSAEAEEELPEPEALSLTTKDGLELKITYYGSLQGKDAVPVVILHDFKGNRNEFHRLALMLQKLGHAVVAPDLRGHGDSTRFRALGNQRPREIDASRMRTARDFGQMVTLDLEEVRRFLITKNNAGELNLNKLCVLGTGGMGSVMALNWALVDWSIPPLATGKQGQDVKALILLSPEWSFRGLTIDRPLAHPQLQSQLSMLIFVGTGGGAAKDAQRIFKRIEPFHPEPPADKVRELKDLFMQELNTSLQGAKLIGGQGLDIVPATIAQFIDLRLVEKDFPWSERRSSN